MFGLINSPCHAYSANLGNYWK